MCDDLSNWQSILTLHHLIPLLLCRGKTRHKIQKNPDLTLTQGVNYEFNEGIYNFSRITWSYEPSADVELWWNLHLYNKNIQ